MQRMRDTDGTRVHRRNARHHMAACKDGEAIHVTLYDEMTVLYNALKAKEREVQDAEDAAVEASAVVQSKEEALENCIRDLDAAAAAADRASSSLGARAAIFPNGFGAEIEPDGDEQLEALTKLKVRVEPFLQQVPAIATAQTAVNTAAVALKAALDAEETANTTVERLFAEEQEARRAIRQQIESAHGRLRDYYKSRPALAERYFLKAGGSSTSTKKKPAANKA